MATRYLVIGLILACALAALGGGAAHLLAGTGCASSWIKLSRRCRAVCSVSPASG